ncbi:hypothetical protein ASPWEDRAFT_115725 [Aspergillus wentii DTO 134E9]|uniref:Uncharacterized protein n=1 Tax=Aspergillus wentii DTO 134E9 TaxID=1073089 RepID=A0A1L9RE29_ASPWE|nr:uncharacterized protein ASPWEDRAFT_115725 [Aspergillus wentii DTO 134E9]OJJ33138.1 hypothetical protein ASPWEDRAFT_115725 [Aspergillus wentii DTO 134E9]
MSSQDNATIQKEPKDQNDSQVIVSDRKPETGKDDIIKLPSVGQILSELTASPPSLAPGGTEALSVDEQKALYSSLQALVKRFEEGDEDESKIDLKEIHASLEQETGAGCNYKTLQSVRIILEKLWKCRSDYLVSASELLANGSRNQSWRLPYGQTRILEFFLQLIASENVNDGLLFHSLRLAGNSCADTDENRVIVVKDNYILAVIRQLLSPGLVQVAIPVLYNICVDFEPAQSQLASNRIAYILLKLIKDGAFKGKDALLSFIYELIEQAAEQAQGIERSPDETILLLIELAIDEDISFAQFTSLASCLTTYLDNQHFQNICVSNSLVERVLVVLTRSFSIKVDSSTDDAQTLAQLQLKINQSLSELSASPLFMEYYPLNSSLSQTLKQWLATSKDQLQICSCVMLGNLARSDEVCETMVRDLNIHKELISILKSNARGAVLHAALGFLKNLAIAGNNRLYLGDAGIIPAISRLWGYDTVPQVQFSAASIARQLIISSVENISRLLESPPPESDSSADSPTYLSLLFALFEKTDSTPVKTEIGRIVASICRIVIPKSREQKGEADLLERLFSLHEGVARPIGAMVTQTQWPVVRSEGWFALALMASSGPGSVAVIDCLQTMEAYPLLEETLSTKPSYEADETERLKLTKDRDNTVILAQELLKNDSGTLPPTWKAKVEDLMKNIFTAVEK